MGEGHLTVRIKSTRLESTPLQESKGGLWASGLFDAYQTEQQLELVSVQNQPVTYSYTLLQP